MKIYRVIGSVVTCSVVLAGASVAFADNPDAITLTTTVMGTVALSCDQTGNPDGTPKTVELGTLTAGTPVTGSTTCTVTTNNATGYTLNVKRDDADTTMDNTADAAVNIADLPNTIAGTSPNNPIPWVDGTTKGLGYTVASTSATGGNITWANAGANYVGFTTAGENIMVSTGYDATSTTTVINYRLDVPSTQQTGTYDGVITYTATINP